ncbi:hypothetical protein ACJMK2_021130 [Sinanodonta woodiana]|uniref:BTB domain-containing protein n=1 Tax=Sinanodonta woodiana TaxID=1069815 RepID=A0ABD3U161_SINWO
MEGNTGALSTYWQVDKSLSQSLSSLLDEGLWTDVTFTFNTDKSVVQIKGHRIILAARSPVFEAMLFRQMESNEVAIVDASSESFKLFLRCLYTDTIDLDEDSLIEVAKLAHRYQVGYLLNRCSVKLAMRIRKVNVCKLLNLAVFYDLKDLKDKACDFIDGHVREVLASPGFLEVSVESMKVILSGDTFYVDELKLFQKCMEWAEKKCKQQGLEPDYQNKRKLLSDGFFFLRLPTLSLADYTEHIVKNNILSVEESLEIYKYKCMPSQPENTQSSQTVLSNSTLPRKQKINTILWPKNASKVEFLCPNDVYLNGIIIENVVEENKVPENYFRDISLDGKVSIKEIEKTATFQIEYSSKLPDFIPLSERIFLKGRKNPYLISIVTRCFTSCDVSAFLHYTNVQQMLFTKWPYCKYPPFINGILYQNLSNR